MAGRTLLVVAGAAALLLTGAFFATNFEGEKVRDFEPSENEAQTVVPAAPTATATAVLVGPQGDTIITSPDSLTVFCLNQFFAEAQCGAVVRELCAELGSTDSRCVAALDAYCATSNPLPTYCDE